ncbi:hypothetical protein ACQ4PT_057420 [Festuca glaucescens]
MRMAERRTDGAGRDGRSGGLKEVLKERVPEEFSGALAPTRRLPPASSSNEVGFQQKANTSEIANRTNQLCEQCKCLMSLVDLPWAGIFVCGMKVKQSGCRFKLQSEISLAQPLRGATEENPHPHPLPQLPFDLQLQIVQRSDALTVVRCAAAHKLLRGAILGPAFRHRLGVDPALLLGFSFWEDGVPRAIDTPPLSTGGSVRLNDVITGRYMFMPVAWRDGPDTTLYNLRVCNASSGDVTDFLPPISLRLQTTPSHRRIFWSQGYYTFVLLTGAAGRSFELLVADRGLQHTQIFDSEQWEWGPVRDTTFPQLTDREGFDDDAFPHPAVIGRTVYWF